MAERSKNWKEMGFSYCAIFLPPSESGNDILFPPVLKTAALREC